MFVGVGYALYNIYGFFFLSSSNISYIGHFGGLFVGLAVGFARKGLKKGLKTLLIGLLVIAAAAALWLFLFKQPASP